MFYTQVLTCLNDRQVVPCVSSTGQRSPTRALIEATLLARRLECRRETLLVEQRARHGAESVVRLVLGAVAQPSEGGVDCVIRRRDACHTTITAVGHGGTGFWRLGSESNVTRTLLTGKV